MAGTEQACQTPDDHPRGDQEGHDCAHLPGHGRLRFLAAHGRPESTNAQPNAGTTSRGFVEEVESRRPTDEEAEFLRISAGQHVLEVVRLARDHVGRTLEVTVHVLPSQMWRLSYEWPAGD